MPQRDKRGSIDARAFRKASRVAIGDMVRSAYMGEGTFGVVVGFSKDWKGDDALDVMWHSPGEEPIIECHVWYDDEVEVINDERRHKE